MNKIFVLIIGIMFCAQLAFAQQNITQEVKDWVQAYQLNDTQQEQVEQLIEMKYFNFQELENIKSSHPELYQQKLKNVDVQTRLGIKSILNEVQLLIYKRNVDAQKAAIRRKIANLRAAGAEKTEIAQAVSELKSLNEELNLLETVKLSNQFKTKYKRYGGSPKEEICRKSLSPIHRYACYTEGAR